MRQFQKTIVVRAGRPGLHEFTPQVDEVVVESGIEAGSCHLFVQHTSASLVIQENADPSARRDLERFFDRLCPENDPEYTHTAEGSDDMPAHLKTALTSTSELVPVMQGRLALGTWQGVYLFEHRRRGSGRRVVVTVIGE